LRGENDEAINPPRFPRQAKSIQRQVNVSPDYAEEYEMKSTPTLRFSIQRLFLLTLVSFVAVAAVLGIAASANKANRAAKALQARQTQATQVVASKSGIIKNSDGQQPLAPNATVITATLDDNVAAATKVAPGGTINYTAVIKNTGTAGTDDATSVNYSHILDSNTSLVAGSVHASPIAINNSYTTAIGNTLLEVSNSPVSTAPKVTAAGTLFDNDTIATTPDTIVLQSFTATSANSGTVAVNANGSFTYLPAAGFTGSDSFTYTIRNSADATLQDTATVTITVNAPRVWYVDNSGANGDGRSTSPFNTLANAAAVDAIGDIIYIFTGGGNYTGGITLLNNEQVIGNGVALVVNTITLRAAGSRPTVVNAGGAGMTLAQNNTLTGFNFGASTGFSLTGTSVGTLNVSNMLINNTTGGALDLTGVTTPTVSVVLDSTTSTGGTKNVNLVGLNGTITLGSGALSAASGNAFDVSGAGTANISFSGTIANTAAFQLINVSGKTGGTVALSGALSGTGSSKGINLATNAGATFTFTGLITLDGASSVFSATGGGTVTSSVATSTIGATNAPSATALNVSNTTIGAAGLTFRTISCNGTANGIILNTTGANAGLTVTGTGSAGTGGTIQNISTRGASFISTRNISLNWMNFTNANTANGAASDGTVGGNENTDENGAIHLATAVNVVLSNINITGTTVQHGINGNTVTNLDLTNVSIANTGDAVWESGIYLFHLKGLASTSQDSVWDNVDITDTAQFNVSIINASGTNAAGGEKDKLTIQNGSSFKNSGKNVIGDHISIFNSVTANFQVVVNGATFDSKINGEYAGAHTSDGIQVDVSGSSARSDATITGCTFTSTTGGGAGQSAINISSTTGAGTFDLETNVATLRQGVGINVAVTGTASLTGTIKGNNLSTNITNNPGFGIALVEEGNGSIVANVESNTIQGTDGPINTVADFDDGIKAGARAGTGSAQLTLKGNTIQSAKSAGVWLFAGNNTGGETNTTCVNFSTAVKNSIHANPATRFDDYFLEQYTGTTFNIQGLSGSGTNAANVNSYVASTDAVAGRVVSSSLGTVVNYTNATCTPPPAPIAPLADEGAMNMSDHAEAVTVLAGPQYAMSVKQSEPASRMPVVKQRAATTANALTNANEVKPNTSFVSNSSAGATAIPSNKRSRNVGLSHHAVRSRSRAADESPNAPLVNVNVALGTLPALPAGKIVTIKYAVTVNSTAPTSRQVSAQGTVTYNGNPGGSVNTTDFSAPNGPNTVTLMDTTSTWTGATSTNWSVATNWSPNTYAPGLTNPAVNDVIIPQVVPNDPTLSVNADIFSLTINNSGLSKTVTISSGSTLTIDGAAAGGDLNFTGTIPIIIAGGALNFAGAGPHIINNANGQGRLSSTNAATILSGASVTQTTNFIMGTLAVNSGATMNISNQTLGLAGPGAALTVAGTFTTTGSTVQFQGGAPQTTDAPTFANLTIFNGTGVTLTGNASASGILNLLSGDLNTGAFTLTQPGTTLSQGTGDVVGKVTRTGGPFTAGIPLTFGNPNNRITFIGGTNRPTTLSVLLAKIAPATYAAAVTRNYTISLTGTNDATATMRLRYLDPGELNGNTEAQLHLRRLRTGDNHWVAQVPDAVDTVNNYVDAAGVLATDLPTQWTFSSLVPTAAGGVVSGRIVDSSGNPVEGAVVRLDGSQSRKFITDANGVYRFENVETGGFYTVTPSRANYSFNPSVRSFSQIGETTEATFGATLSTSGFVNPLDTPEYFVRQNYLDFLGREPDESGFNFWSDQILSCGNDNQCIDRKRENVSAAYFLSIEFQQTGGLVDGLYRASYGARPDFAQFMPDTRTVGQGVQVGFEGWEAKLAANKEAFINSFVNRAAFHAAYDGLSSSDFVDALISHTGVSFTASERDALVSGLGTGTMTRAEALRTIAENQPFVSAKFNDTFVMMEYFGYLRRDADAAGFQFWLYKLNQFGGNFEEAEMVKAFIVSGEYRDRFPR
jgi:hypothetical protein